jgi:hypothetical protein
MAGGKEVLIQVGVNGLAMERPWIEFASQQSKRKREI